MFYIDCWWLPISLPSSLPELLELTTENSVFVLDSNCVLAHIRAEFCEEGDSHEGELAYFRIKFDTCLNNIVDHVFKEDCKTDAYQTAAFTETTKITGFYAQTDYYEDSDNFGLVTGLYLSFDVGGVVMAGAVTVPTEDQLVEVTTDVVGFTFRTDDANTGECSGLGLKVKKPASTGSNADPCYFNEGVFDQGLRIDPVDG